MTKEDLVNISKNLAFRYNFRINMYHEYVPEHSMTRAVCRMWIDGNEYAGCYYFEENNQTFEQADPKDMQAWAEKMVDSTLGHVQNSRVR